MNEPSASDTFMMDVTTPQGASWSTVEDGTLRLVDASGDPLITIDKPWAVDAAGESLPTSLAVEGNSLVQKIDTRGADFPIVADPSLWSWVKNATLCAAGIASFLAVSAKVTQAGTKLYKALRGAKYGTVLYKAYRAFLALGGTNVARMKNLLTAVVAFAKKVASSGLSKASAMLKSSYGNQYAVMVGATGVIASALGIDSCVWMLQQAF